MATGCFNLCRELPNELLLLPVHQQLGEEAKPGKAASALPSLLTYKSLGAFKRGC